MDVTIRRGLDISLSGAPRQSVLDASESDVFALQGADFPDVRASLRVSVGDRVAAGQTLFVDQRRPRIAFTAPAAGMVIAINRGRRRSLASLVIQRAGAERVAFEPAGSAASREQIRDLLLRAGLWPNFVARPFGRIPDPDSAPAAMFVAAMDSNPLAADARTVLADHREDFNAGLEALKRLTDGPVYVCQAPGRAMADLVDDRIRTVRFRGPHPAGLPGTHIHFLAPVGGGRVVWQVNYQEVVAIGKLVARGEIWGERVVSLAGPAVRSPRLLRAGLCVDLDRLLAAELIEGPVRVLSGSALSGRSARYLGRHHQQITVLPEDNGDTRSGSSFLRSLAGFGTLGTPGAIVPIETYERVMPLSVLPAPLLRALSVGDEEAAERLGCLELLEEDLALLTYVCPSKTEYGPLLRGVLNKLAGEAP